MALTTFKGTSAVHHTAFAVRPVKVALTIVTDIESIIAGTILHRLLMDAFDWCALCVYVQRLELKPISINPPFEILIS